MGKINRLISELVYKIIYFKYKYLKRKYEKTADKLYRTLVELQLMERLNR